MSGCDQYFITYLILNAFNAFNGFKIVLHELRKIYLMENYSSPCLIIKTIVEICNLNVYYQEKKYTL